MKIGREWLNRGKRSWKNGGVWRQAARVPGESSESLGTSLPLFLPSMDRFQLNRDLAGFHLTNRAELQVEELDRLIKFSFPDPEPMRFPGALNSANNVSFAYLRMTLENITLTIHPGARIGLASQNGEGKSTLGKLLIGVLRPRKAPSNVIRGFDWVTLTSPMLRSYPSLK